MRWRVASSVLVAVTALSACNRVSPTVAGAEPPGFSIHQLPPSPSALRFEVQSGAVQGLIPGDWDAAPISQTRFPAQGFVASPQLEDWELQAGVVRGMEAFWIDVGNLEVASDFYYAVARGPAMSSITSNKACHPTTREVVADNPPDLTGWGFSPGDYVVSARGTCQTDGRPTRWAYIVVAPGFGPERVVGLPSSGLYVVVAVVSGRQAGALLQEMIDGARFANVPISQIVAAARTTT